MFQNNIENSRLKNFVKLLTHFFKVTDRAVEYTEALLNLA